MVGNQALSGLSWAPMLKQAGRSAAISGGALAATGFVASGGEPRGALSGISGGMHGAFSGMTRGLLLGGALGAAVGVGMAVTQKPRLASLMRRAVPWLAQRFPLGLNIHGANIATRGDAKTFLTGAVESVLKDSPLWHYAAIGGAAGGAAGVIGGQALGGLTGAWSAGRNVRASRPYNQFGGIGL